ncbi:MAG: hypothetical protein PHE88_10245 [Elusimicrobia bacterium]|nr:hypothetical protein [Elusimicrobiota bacterium]
MMKVKSTAKCHSESSDVIASVSEAIPNTRERLLHDKVSLPAVRQVRNDRQSSHSDHIRFAQCKLREESRIKIATGFALAITFLLLITARLHAGGVSATFADLILENLQIGESYNLRVLKKCPMIIQNKGGSTVDAIITVDFPRKDKLKEGYEAIPDLEWVKVVPDKFRLGPGEKGISDIIVTIPNDEKLIGKHYQVHLISAGSPIGQQGQVTIATGSQTRFRFSIGSMGPESLKKEKKNKKMHTLNFEFDPVNITIKDAIELGKKIDLKKEKNVRLKLINKATETLKLKIKAVTYDINMYGSVESGYELGNPDFVKVKPEDIMLEGETIEKLDVFIEIPNEEKYKNKKYIFLIKAEVINEIPVEIVSKLYVITGE